MKTSTIILAPKNKSDTIVEFSDAGRSCYFDVGEYYDRALVFLDKKIVLVFFGGYGKSMQCVGAAFDFKGRKLFDIPFPKIRLRNPLSKISFGWCSPLENGVKIIFGSDASGAEDFWCDFDFSKRDYVDSGKAY